LFVNYAAAKHGVIAVDLANYGRALAAASSPRMLSVAAVATAVCGSFPTPRRGSPEP